MRTTEKRIGKTMFALIGHRSLIEKARQTGIDYQEFFYSPLVNSLYRVSILNGLGK